MATKFTVTIDCSDPDRLAHFWAAALAYEIESPPPGFSSWRTYWRSRGVPDAELYDGADSVVDPSGAGPRIWFQQVDERKSVKNRVHLDIHVGGGRKVAIARRKELVNAEAERLVGLGAERIKSLEEAGVDHYAVAMRDPEGNEFDLN